MKRTLDPPFRQVAPRVYVRRQTHLDLNIGLVVGEERCLVIDTGATTAQAEAIQAALRQVSDRSWMVVNTHGHHDHCFGNASFADTDIWAHPGCAAMLAESGEQQRAAAVDAAHRSGDAALGGALKDVAIVPPTRPVHDVVRLDLGGVSVALRHLGRGHTDHDLVVEVPGAALFVGDLVEQGAPPVFEDAWPLDWPATLARVVDLADDLPVVPGHGAVVDRAFVADQRRALTRVPELAAAVAAGRLSPGSARTSLQRQFGEQGAIALTRASWQRTQGEGR